MAYHLTLVPEGGHYPMVDWGGEPVGSPALHPQNDQERISASTRGVPVTGSGFPKRVRWLEKKDYPPPDFDKTPYWTVSDRARQVIERIEPGVHQFFPVEYVDSEGRHLENRFWFVVCNRLNAVDGKHSNMVLTPGGSWIGPRNAKLMGLEIPEGASADIPPLIVFNREVIGDKHFWRDRHLSGGPWLSDEAAAAINAERLTGVRLDEKRWIEEV